MANGAFKFKDNSGNVVAHISGSGTGIMVSGSALGLTGSVDVVGSLSVNGSPIISNYSQLTSSLDTRYVLSGSITQTTWDNIASKPSGIVSGSSQISGLGYAITGSNIFQGNQTINGNVVVTGSLTAQQFIVSSSVTYMTTSFSSGSTKFGDDTGDAHNFTGSVYVTGSLRIPTASSTGNITGTAAGQLFFNTTDNNIYRYNGAAWLAAAGSSGTSGSSGSSGTAGTSGSSGSAGTSGSSGTSGTSGSSGSAGTSGSSGSAGSSGTSGAAGSSGSSGSSGASGSSGSSGATGSSGTSGAAIINSNTDNYVLTATGTAGTIQGEANLTFDGSTLGVTGAATVSGKFTQGGGASRSTSGTTISLTVNSGFTANSDIGDGNRYFSIVNNSSTANAYAALSFRINPNAGTNNAMFDLRYANGSASNNSSTLYWTFNDGGAFYDRMTLTSAGALSATSFTGAGSGLTSLPTNTALYPTLNQSTTGNAASATYANTLYSSDVRTIAPNSHTAYRATFGFTSWANNNTSTWADYIHLRSYGDSSGGADNLVMFNKSSIAMRVWQQTWNSGTAYSSYADVLMSNNYTSYSPSLTGSGASGTWGINVTGTANNITAYTINQSVGTSNSPTFASVYSNGLLYAGYASSASTAGSDLGLNIYAGSDSSGYGRIRFYFNGTNQSTIHAFSNSWSTNFSSGSRGAININGYNGVTFGGWNAPAAYIDNAGVSYFASTMTVNGILQPNTTATYTLGTSSLRWSTIYTNDLSLKNEYGDYTIVEGEENLYLYNNKSGKVFTFNLTEVDPTTAPPKKYLD